LLTNSTRKKRGPKEVHAGTIYGFAHQAYFGFKSLAENTPPHWKQILGAKTAGAIQKVGEECTQPGAMAKAGYGARGLMTWLVKPEVASRVIEAKAHRRYPDSKRPSSEDRRMIFLAIAVAAGIWEREFSTVLRILAEAGLGIDYMARDVHRFDQMEAYVKQNSIVWAEPLGNYLLYLPGGKVLQMQKLPCKVPSNCRTGFIIFGYGPSGLEEATYSPTLPSCLAPVPR
jgi:hypothetical protein